MRDGEFVPLGVGDKPGGAAGRATTRARIRLLRETVPAEGRSRVAHQSPPLGPARSCWAIATRSGGKRCSAAKPISSASSLQT